MVEAFASAATSGDLATLIHLLNPDVVLVGAGGGLASSARKPVLGPDRAARFLLGVLAKEQPGDQIGRVLVNGAPGFAVYQQGKLVTIASVTVAAGRITRLDLIRGPHHTAQPKPTTDSLAEIARFRLARWPQLIYSAQQLALPHPPQRPRPAAALLLRCDSHSAAALPLRRNSHSAAAPTRHHPGSAAPPPLHRPHSRTSPPQHSRHAATPTRSQRRTPPPRRLGKCIPQVSIYRSVRNLTGVIFE